MRTVLIPIVALISLAEIAHCFPDLLDSGETHHDLSATFVQRGSSFTFSTGIDNDGDADATDVKVRFYTSSDQVLGGLDDQLVGSLTVPRIKSGIPVEITATLTIPPRGSGAAPYWLLWDFTIPEDNKPSNNHGIYLGSQINTNPPLPEFDLHPGNQIFTHFNPHQLAPGESFTANHQVCNAGPGSSPGFTVKYWLSLDGNFGDPDDVLLGESGGVSIEAPTRGPACHNFQQVLWIPADQPDDNYRLGYTIGSLLDTDQSNNSELFEGLVTVRRPTNGPDLIDAGPGYWSIPNPALGQIPRFTSGAPIPLEANVLNVGNANASSFNVTFYATTDGELGNADDIFIIRQNFGAVPSDNYLNPFPIDTLIPTDDLATDVFYRFGWVIDSDEDLNTGNNSAVMDTVFTIREGHDLALMDNWVVAGELNTNNDACFYFNGNVINRGDEPVFAYFYAVFNDLDSNRSYRAYMSRELDGYQIDGEDFLGSDDINVRYRYNITADSQHRLGFFKPRGKLFNPDAAAFLGQHRIPTGDYEVTIHVESESGERYPFDRLPDPTPADNVFTLPDTVHISGKSRPDLKLTGQLSQETIQPGSTVTITGYVKNEGVEDAPASEVRFFLDDQEIGTPYPIGALDRRDETSFVHSVTIPLTSPTGDLILSAVVDPFDDITEDSECNNDLNFRITVGFLPDLRESVGHQSYPAAVAPGGSFNLQWRIVNFGFGNAGASTVNYFIKRAILEPFADEELLGSFDIGSLDVLETRIINAELQLRADLDPGVYELRWFIDADYTVDEISEINNEVFGETLLTVGSFTNLGPGSIPFTTSRDSVHEPGQGFFLRGTRRNNGSLAAGVHRDQVRLIPENSITADEIVLKEIIIDPRANLLGVDYLVNELVAIPADIPPGNYLLSYLQDTGNVVTETEETDNRSTINITVVDVGEPPRITSIEKIGSDIDLMFSSRPDRNYQLQRSTDLADWENVGLILGGQPIFIDHTFDNAAATDLEAQFRIIELPQP